MCVCSWRYRPILFFRKNISIRWRNMCFNDVILGAIFLTDCLGWCHWNTHFSIGSKYFFKKKVCVDIYSTTRICWWEKNLKKIILTELSTIKDFLFFQKKFQNFFSDFFSDPTSALIEIDRISEALGNQAWFRYREDATKKKLKKKRILRYFLRFFKVMTQKKSAL